MDRITEPTPNTPLSASWARDVTRALNGLRISGGRGVLVGQDAHGVSISLASSFAPSQSTNNGPDPACLAVVNSGSALAGYSVSLYANGLDAAPTGTGTLYVPECSAYSGLDLPEGSVLIAHSTMVVATGGSET